jgi:hypothetical protein
MKPRAKQLAQRFLNRLSVGDRDASSVIVGSIVIRCADPESLPKPWIEQRESQSCSEIRL